MSGDFCTALYVRLLQISHTVYVCHFKSLRVSDTSLWTYKYLEKKKITSEVQTNQANIQNYKQLAVCHDMADPDSKLSVVNDNM